MKRIILIHCILFFSLGLKAQSNHDIMTLSPVREPLTLHEGRFRASLSYQFTYLSHFFDTDGQVMRSIDYGSIGSRNQYTMNVEYGLTNFIQLGVMLDHSTGVESFRSYSKLMENGQEARHYSRIKKLQGPGSMSFALGIRIPIGQEKLEIAVFPLINISTGTSAPREPELEIQNIREDILNIVVTEYEKVGHGFINTALEVVSKYRFSEKLAIQASGYYQKSIIQRDTYKWDLKNNLDGYFFTKSNISNKDLILFGTELCFFIVPDKKEIIGINLGITYQNKQFEYYKHDSEVSFTEERNSLETFGLINLVLSKNLRYSQKLGVDISGKDYHAGFSFLSTFSYQILCK